MNTLILKMWFGTVFTLLSSLLPTWMIQEKHVMAKPRALVSRPAEPAMVKQKLILPTPPVTEPTMTAVVCKLQGQVLQEGIPQAQAKLHIWVTSPYSQEFRELTTDAEGRYQLSVDIAAREAEPLDWEIKVQTQDLQTIEKAGRRIVREGDTLVSVHNILDIPAH